VCGKSFLAAFQEFLVITILLKRVYHSEPGWVVSSDFKPAETALSSICFRTC
jgi:hypothetical protein